MVIKDNVSYFGGRFEIGMALDIKGVRSSKCQTNNRIKTMSIVKYQRFPSIVENFLNRELNGYYPGQLATANAFASMPAVNVAEDQESFHIEVAVPGMKKEDFKINLNNNRLTVSAQQEVQKEQETNTENKTPKYVRREFSYSTFQRTFSLPKSVNGDKVEATYTDGILHIALPKREEAKEKPAREITIA